MGDLAGDPIGKMMGGLPGDLSGDLAGDLSGCVGGDWRIGGGWGTNVRVGGLLDRGGIAVLLGLGRVPPTLTLTRGPVGRSPASRSFMLLDH